MQIPTSKLTKKYQATIPEPVRSKLGLAAGDLIAFNIDHEVITVRKASPVDLLFAQSLEGTLTEWNSQADEDAYKSL